MKVMLSLNPVLVKELRGRMRGARAYIILTATLGLMGLVGYGLYRITRASVQYYGGQQSAAIGQGVFTGLVFFALGVLCFITPALTAGAISGEHERKTFDMLLATPMRPAAILFGKLVASLSYAALIVVAAVPLVSLSYVFGGVAWLDMLQAFLLLLGYTLTFGVIGLFFSTLLRRTALATVFSYIVLAFFVFGTVFVYGVIAVVRSQQPPSWILAPNPFSALASALVNASSPNALSMSGFVQPFLWVLSGGGFDLSIAMPMPLWRYTLGLYAWLTVTLYMASAVLVRPVRRFRLGARGWAGLAAFLVVSALAIPVAYGPLTPARVLTWLRWTLSTKNELVTNGTFGSPLEPAWTVSTEVERSDEAGGEVSLVQEAGRPAAKLARTGSQHAETRITQIIDRAVTADKWLQLRLVLRVQGQDVPMCGVLGSECPLMAKLVYEDANAVRHEWVQGFYAIGDLASSSTPPFCTTCEINQPHIQVPLDEWYTYESPNLLADLAARGYALPSVIHAITLAAGGHSYQAQVSEVSLIMREGQPPAWTGVFGATPTPPAFPAGMMGNDGIVVPVPAPPVVR